MEENYQHTEDDQPETIELLQVSREVIPDVPVVRSNTPRPMPFALAPAKTSLPVAPAGFPAIAPDAPPLPEEDDDEDDEDDENDENDTILTAENMTLAASGNVATAETGPEESTTIEGNPIVPFTEVHRTPGEPQALHSEFIWLFEYGLDMDPTRLNRPDRLDGAAFAYGQGMLKGYELSFTGLDVRTGQVLPTLEPTPEQTATEVWGTLYRVPRRLTRGVPDALLDRVHHAESMMPAEVQVREPYRQRELTCLTYVASDAARRLTRQKSADERKPEPTYVQQLLEVAHRQKLPASYLQTLESLVPETIPAATPLPTTPPEQVSESMPPSASLLHKPQRRTVRPLTSDTSETLYKARRGPGPWETPYSRFLERWLMAFAVYDCTLLLLVVVLAVFQGLGFWSTVLNDGFTPLGIPWYVLVYGLIGGCISCLITLVRPSYTYPPTFVVFTWYIRPVVGAMLAAFAWLLLNSGFLVLSTDPTRHFALSCILAGLAGLCEGKLFTTQGKGL